MEGAAGGVAGGTACGNAGRVGDKPKRVRHHGALRVLDPIHSYSCGYTSISAKGRKPSIWLWTMATLCPLSTSNVTQKIVHMNNRQVFTHRNLLSTTECTTDVVQHVSVAACERNGTACAAARGSLSSCYATAEYWRINRFRWPRHGHGDSGIGESSRCERGSRSGGSCDVSGVNGCYAPRGGLDPPPSLLQLMRRGCSWPDTSLLPSAPTLSRPKR